jgi:hypothetical protein
VAEPRRDHHMEVLLHALTAHADTIRHHIRGTAHNATLGAAAESGVRELLRRHLPSTLAVTSGFVRSSDAKLLELGDKKDLSRQTDVIVYDATRACPLYYFDGIEIVAAEDVLAVVEVKDSSADEGVLGQGGGAPGALGALEHMKRLAKLVPEAFRAIVLLQGGDPKKALDELKTAKLTVEDSPHAIYCRAYDEEKESYLGFLDEIAGKFLVHAYKKDRGSPLVGFLRMIVGHMVARGLMSGALLPGLAPYAPDGRSEHSLGPELPPLHDAILSHNSTVGGGSTVSIHEMFKSYVKSFEKSTILVVPAPGVDAENSAAVGSLLRVDYQEKGAALPKKAASFFSLNKSIRILECVGTKQTDRWQVLDELLLDYVRRMFSDQTSVEILRSRGFFAGRR